MNTNQLNLTLLLLCYVATGREPPDDAAVAAKLGEILPDGSNLLTVCVSILRDVPGTQHINVVRGLVQNAIQQLATLKGLLS